MDLEALRNPKTPEEELMAQLNVAVHAQGYEFRNTYRILEIVTFNTDPQKPLGKFCHELVGFKKTEILGVPGTLKDIDTDQQTGEYLLNAEYEMLYDVYENGADLSEKEEETDPLIKKLMDETPLPVRENDKNLAVFLKALVQENIPIEQARARASLDTDIKPNW
jgi:hypothetical protein